MQTNYKGNCARRQLRRALYAQNSQVWVAADPIPVQQAQVGAGQRDQHLRSALQRHIQGATKDHGYIGLDRYGLSYSGKCRIEMGYFVNFVKSTMMKSVIEGKSQEETVRTAKILAD